jgi:hypothetical protein
LEDMHKGGSAQSAKAIWQIAPRVTQLSEPTLETRP